MSVKPGNEHWTAFPSATPDVALTTTATLASAFSRCLREKGLNLLLYFSAVAAGALNPFFVVLVDCQRESETLSTLFAKIFVKRHRNPPLDFLWRPKLKQL